MTSPISAVTGTTANALMADAATNGSTTGSSTNTGSSTSTDATNSSTSSSSSSSSSAGLSGLLDPQAFLKLLVAQLQYQDPTNPTDTSTFMNQTAMLSQVQTMNSMSSTLSELVASQQAQSATSLIGKDVTYTDSSGASKTGLVSSASISGSTATLSIGGATVPLSSVTTVQAAASPTA